jgi:xanthine dehydrogenase YagT iron-sulfur-binding subunit
MHDDDQDVSRRDFFKTVGVGSIATAVVSGVRDVEAQGPGAIGPGDVPITLTINGQRHQLRVEPRMTLLDAMRTRLDITGQKRVCDRGACGACTVIIDPPTDAKSASAGPGGRTYYSCSMLAIEAQAGNIRTVDGLAKGNVLHPVQQAFCDHDGLMCGFCTPGFVMATVALLEKNPNPTPEQAKRALDGNLCRCGTNIGVLKAALSAKGVTRG